MATSFSFAFQPQPPSHPKTNAGKRGPSLPIAILSPSDDSESDISITDFSPPSNSRTTAPELSKISVPPLPSPRNPSIANKKPSLPISLSPRLSSNNVSNAVSNITTSVVTTHISSGNLNSSSLPASSSTLYNTTATTTSNIGFQPLSGSNSHNALGSSTAALPSTLLTSSSTSSSSSSSSSLPSTIIPLPTPAASGTKTLPPAIAIPSQTAATHTTGIPALCNSALSPTTSSQTTNTNGNSSSHDSHKENDSPSSSPRNRSCSPSSNFAYEHDHDYENVASPCSSTASGPTYIRPVGFQHHAQEVIAKTKPKKKKTSATLVTLREGYKKREPTPPKLKPKREPLPMKLRALPQSFWQQPNVTNQVSPASNFPILPPLCHKDTEEAMDERPVTPPEEREGGLKLPERKITVANTDLLFKLFEGIGEEKKSSQSRNKQNSRHKKPVAKSNTTLLFNGNDPYLMEDVTEKIFPQLNLEGRKPPAGGGNACLQLITLKDGDRDVTLPSLSMEQNYPQLLSELVMHI